MDTNGHSKYPEVILTDRERFARMQKVAANFPQIDIFMTPYNSNAERMPVQDGTSLARIICVEDGAQKDFWQGVDQLDRQALDIEIRPVTN